MKAGIRLDIFGGRIPVGRVRRLLAAAACAACAGTAAAAQAQAFTIVGACVFDGERVLPPDTEVRVQHGLILAVGPNVGLPRGGTVIDGRGKTLVPGTVQAPQASPAAAAHGAAIVTGARADLALVEGDASQDPQAARDVVAVWKDGLLLPRGSAAKPLLH